MKKFDLKYFINKSNATHNNKYDYSKSVANKYRDKVIIICPKHGEFIQEAGKHMYANGCPVCGRLNTINGSLVKFNSLKFINESNIIHNNKYDYSLIKDFNRGGNRVKIDIICPLHGIFKQSAGKHLSGQGCPKCGKSKKLTLDEFKEIANNIHNFKYNYNKIINYKNLRSQIKIICPTHGGFLQLAMNHLAGHGCSKCYFSKGEKLIIDIFHDLDINDYVCEKTFNDLTNKKTGKKLRYDFYLPTYNLLIEYDGCQHFYPAYFNSNQTKDDAINDLSEIKHRDKIKTMYAHKNNIKLLRINYKNIDINEIKKLIKKYLR